MAHRYWLIGLLLWAAGCGNTAIKITAVPAEPGVVEQEITRDSVFSSRKIAVIDLDGVIINRHATSLIGIEQPNPTAEFVAKLDAARQDSAVKAVILRINSPGGTVAASAICHDEVLRFKRLSGKPVITMMLDVTASGGYYTACASDHLIAQPSTLCGSIGVIMQTFNFSGTMVKLGIASDAIVSGPFKDAGSPLRPLTPAERAYFQTMIDQFYSQFLDAVRQGRPKLAADDAKLRKIADGRVYTGTQALELGLVDELGTIHEAIREAKRRAGVKSAVIVAYGASSGYRMNVYDQSQRAAPSDLTAVDPARLTEMAQPHFLYLWAGSVVP